jgi:heme-degrading monooxygenase HmoA
MIARWWRGCTTPENAEAYEALLRTTVLPGIERHRGYRGAYLLRREVGDEVEFATLTCWDSLDAIRAWAGEDYEVAVISDEARVLLAGYDGRSTHFETLLTP